MEEKILNARKALEEHEERISCEYKEREESIRRCTNCIFFETKDTGFWIFKKNISYCKVREEEMSNKTVYNKVSLCIRAETCPCYENKYEYLISQEEKEYENFKINR